MTVHNQRAITPQDMTRLRLVSDPQLSPYGEGFTYDRRPHIFVVSADGGPPQQLTDGDFAHADPAWSPDSTLIAFTSARHEDPGELPGEVYEEVFYEGYGAGGVAVLVDVLTDNKNRTVAEIRHLFAKHGGSLGESGCVAWMFGRKGLITLSTSQIEEDDLLEIVLEAGGDDIKVESDAYEIITAPEAFEDVRAALEQKGLTLDVAEVTMLPQNTVPVEGKQAEQVLRLMEGLDDQDDVRKAHANFDISEDVMAALAS